MNRSAADQSIVRTIIVASRRGDVTEGEAVRPGVTSALDLCFSYGVRADVGAAAPLVIGVGD